MFICNWNVIVLFEMDEDVPGHPNSESILDSPEELLVQAGLESHRNEVTPTVEFRGQYTFTSNKEVRYAGREVESILEPDDRFHERTFEELDHLEDLGRDPLTPDEWFRREGTNLSPDAQIRNKETRVECRAHEYGTCPRCEGGGRIGCERCSGSGRAACTSCDGTGTVTEEVPCSCQDGRVVRTEEPDRRGAPERVTTELCSRCNGSGTFDTRTRPCHECDEDDRIQCPDCTGEGEITCTGCEGDGAAHSYEKVTDTYWIEHSANLEPSLSEYAELIQGASGLDWKIVDEADREYEQEDSENSVIREQQTTWAVPTQKIEYTRSSDEDGRETTVISLEQVKDNVKILSDRTDSFDIHHDTHQKSDGGDSRILTSPGDIAFVAVGSLVLAILFGQGVEWLEDGGSTLFGWLAILSVLGAAAVIPPLGFGTGIIIVARWAYLLFVGQAALTPAIRALGFGFVPIAVAVGSLGYRRLRR